MSKLVYIFASLLCFSLSEGVGLGAGLKLSTQQSWTYELISASGSSSDESLIQVNVEVEIVSRGEYKLTGIIDLKFEATDETKLEMQAFSSSDDKNYKKLPFAIQKEPLIDFFNKEYKEMLMEGLKNCSNLPYFDGVLEPPLGPITFELNKCSFLTEKLPQHLPEGYYKVKIFGSGQVDWTIELLAKLETIKF